ncbi:MAG: NAD(P)H-dependent oxidoreductase subunit E [Bacillota bacterium]
MADNIPYNKIVICLGSSCFSRGNNRNLEVIQEFAKNNKLRIDLEVIGNLCEDKCNQGPNIRINDKLYTNIDPNSLFELLNRLLVRG